VYADRIQIPIAVDRSLDASPEPEPPGHAWLEGLFREHYAGLCSFVYGYLSSDDAAEDLVQDLFVAIWRDPMRWYEAGDALRPLLYVAARNRALDALKHQRVRDRHAVAVAGSESMRAAPAADVVVAHRQVQQALDAAVAALPARAREIYLLSREQGLTYREIAERLGISVKTVETQMSRSLKRLRLDLAIYLSLSLFALVR
jgi:RNA polymerase sigma-70 factor (ECF subfamily)